MRSKHWPTKNKILICFGLVGIFISPVFGQEFGSAIINSVPDSADVYIDGYPFGKTPFIPVKIIPGTYQLKLKHQGYDSLIADMNIESGKRLTGKITLKKYSDSLQADSVVIPPPGIPKRGEFVELSEFPQIKNRKKLSWPGFNGYKGPEGKIVLALLLDLDGKVMDAEIAKSSGSFCLDYEALKAANNFTFSTALDKDKKPARAWIIYPITFIIN